MCLVVRLSALGPPNLQFRPPPSPCNSCGKPPGRSMGSPEAQKSPKSQQKVTKKPGDDAQKSPKSQQKVTKKPGDDAQKITQKPPKRPKKVLAWPGTRGPSNFHQSTSKSASRAPRHTPGRGIAARVDLEGSRGLESLPGALFFSRSDVTFFGKTSFLPGKNAPAGQATCRTTGAGGRRQAGGGRRQAGAAPEAKKCASAAGNAWAFDFARIDL